MSSPERITPFLKQTWCATSVIIAVIGQGMLLGHGGSLFAALFAPDSPIKLNIHSASWLASSPGFAALIGIAASCGLMDRFGRRKAILLSILPGTLGWVMTYLAQNYSVLLIGRLLVGISAGAVCIVGGIAISEYTSPKNRGMFLSLKTAAIMIGSAIVHILDNYMHWRTIAIVALIPNIIAFLIIWTWPESPTWLATRQRFDECKQEFFWLRGVNEETAQEVSELITAQKERLPQLRKKWNLMKNIAELLKKFTKKDFLKPLWAATIANFVMEASGRHYFPTYARQIMGDIINTKFSPYYYTLSVDLITVAGSLLSSVLIRMIKRRTLLFSTGIASLIILVCMCVYLFLISTNMVSDNGPLLITFIFILYFFISNLGCTPIPLTLQSELFPVAHRESGSSVLAVVICLNCMGTIYVTPYLLATIKVYGTFAFFGTVMAISLLILYFILPETKDRSLQEIENYYNHGRLKNNKKCYNMEAKMIDGEHE